MRVESIFVERGGVGDAQLRERAVIAVDAPGVVAGVHVLRKKDVHEISAERVQVGLERAAKGGDDRPRVGRSDVG